MNQGTGQWGPDTPLVGITGQSYDYTSATLSPDGQSLFAENDGATAIQRSKLTPSGTWSAPQTVLTIDNGNYPYFNGKHVFYSKSFSGVYHIMASDYNSSLDAFGCRIP